MRLTGASLTLPTCCLGTSSPDLGSGMSGPEGRGFGGVLSWWVGCILLRQKGPHRTPAPSGPALSGGESTGSRDEQSFFRMLPPKPARALRRHQRPSHPFSSLLAGLRASAAAALFDLKRNPRVCCWSVAKSCPALCNPRDCSTSGSSGVPVSWSVLKFMSIESW